MTARPPAPSAPSRPNQGQGAARTRPVRKGKGSEAPSPSGTLCRVKTTFRNQIPWCFGALPSVMLAAVMLAAVMLAAQAVPVAQAAPSARNPGEHEPRASSRPAHLPAISGLDISVTDGRSRVVPGDLLSYAVRVTDGGAGPARNLQITLMLPPYLKLLSARGPHRFAEGKVSWALTLNAGHSASFDARAQLHRVPAGVGHLAVVACAGSGAKTLVCAAHLDKLPGAVSAARTGHAAEGARQGDVSGVTSGGRSKYLLGGVALLVTLLLAAAAASLIRARRPRLVRHKRSA